MARRSFSKKDRARIFAAAEIAAFRSTIAYDPEIGRMSWIVPPTNSTARPGDEIGSVSQGYRRVKIAGRSIMCHRIAWAIYYNQDPPAFIDHINGNRLDNRIDNLRLASRAENACNKSAYRKASDLPKGVTFHSSTGLYRARIRFGGKLHSLGLFASPEEAGQAYRKAADKYFGAFARGVV